PTQIQANELPTISYSRLRGEMSASSSPAPLRPGGAAGSLKEHGTGLGSEGPLEGRSVCARSGASEATVMTEQPMARPSATKGLRVDLDEVMRTSSASALSTRSLLHREPAAASL